MPIRLMETALAPYLGLDARSVYEIQPQTHVNRDDTNSNDGRMEQKATFQVYENNL